MEERTTTMDKFFRGGNSIVITNVARGLRKADADYLDKLKSYDLVRFLAAEGEAPRQFLRAIMRQHDLRYWDIKKRRQMIVNALVLKTGMPNAASGPHAKELVKLYKSKLPLDDNIIDFVNEVAPQPVQAPSMYRDQKLMPGQLMMCHVPSVADDPDVLQALAECPITNIFELGGAQVIVELQWKKVRLTTYRIVAWQTLTLTMFVLLNLLLNSSRLSSVLRYVAWPTLIMWGIDVLLKFGEMFGYIAYGHGRRFFVSVFQWFEFLRLFFNGGVLCIVVLYGKDAKGYTSFNVCLGVLVCIKWLKCLHVFCAIRSIGLRILPIMFTLKEVGPFSAVVLVFLCAATNAYYALDLHSTVDSFFVIFLTTFLGEIELDELEGVESSSKLLADRTIHTSPPHQSNNYYAVRVFLCVVVFVMSTALMNIFIAVLSNAYNKATSSALNEFLRVRTGIALHHYIMMTGLKNVCGRVGGRARAALESQTVVDKEVFSYLWYFSPQEDLQVDDD